MGDAYALAYTLNTTTIPVKDNQYISRNMDLYGLEKEINVNAKWESDTPDVVSHTGRYNPADLTEDIPVQLSCELSCGDYFWTDTFHVKARKESLPDGNWASWHKSIL